MRKSLAQSLSMGAAAAAFIAINPSAVHADEVEEGAKVLDQVFVTAQKRQQSSQDVPIAISTFSGDELKNLGAGNLIDLADFVPGATLYNERGAGQPTWIIRGVGLVDFNSNNTPAAAIYYDEFYLISNVMGGIGLFDTARVEVLKGPQGGLYGRNTTGGAVRVISNTPALEDFNGYIRGSYGSWDRYGVEGAIGGRITDKVGFRISGKTDQGGGWQDSLATPGDDEHGDADFWALKGQLKFEPNENLDVLIKFEGGEDKSETVLANATGAYDVTVPPTLQNPNGFCGAVLSGRQDNQNCATYAAVQDVFFGGTGGLAPSLQDSDGSTVLSSPDNRLDNQWQGITGRVDWDLGDVTLTSITSHLSYDNNFVFDFDATERVFLLERGEADIESWSQELRLASDSDGPLSWIAGAMYAEEENEEFRLANLDDNFIFQATFSCFAGNLALCQAGFPFANFEASRGFKQDGQTWAVYAQGDYELNDILRVNGSVRYTDEEKHLRDGFYEAVTNGFFLHQGTNSDYELESHWSGHVGIDWTPNDNTLIYGKVSRGFKSGGFFGGFALSPDQLDPYDEELVNSYELGLKTDLLDSRLRLNGSVFYYDYQDVQGFITVNTIIGVQGRLTNAGDAEHVGLELDVLWLPEAIEGLSLAAGVALIDAEISDSDEANFDQNGVLRPLEGLSRANTPERSVSVQARYEKMVTDDLLGALQLNYSYRSDVNPRGAYSSTVGFGLNPWGGNELLNARLSLGSETGGWDVALVGRNITDEEYLANTSFDGIGSFNQTLARPASYSVEVGYQW